ncbi:alanine racemase C-terminal domain-containing protein [Microbacterium sp. ASV81]|uniref:Alanine racemase C-terminal domain-containing protein n=1 Tax=Microbacterium capsulatum TaxID=3041921 RepID=A0ABU0XC62_9MICO|nr:alanine racemase C-terminal domain-containing protein [Microbacterium sp. ASV81]MDQ4212693.1 alanine racemase C-terminal domain-containing protein [Microbacterium sp. ASV81]
MSERTRSAMLRSCISRSALALGAARAVEAGGAGIADLRRDAWGHGLLAVAQAVTAAGARAVRVDGDAEAQALALEGVAATWTDEPDLDPRLLYGLPDDDGSLPGAPVMRVVGRVLSTKDIAAGGGVSYGYIHRAPEDSRLALITGGYAQGVVRALGSTASVEIDGIVHPIVGRIAMDVCVVDIGDADVRMGAEATYFGGRGPLAAGAADWARITGMGVGELVAVVGRRTERAWEA